MKRPWTKVFAGLGMFLGLALLVGVWEWNRQIPTLSYGNWHSHTSLSGEEFKADSLRLLVVGDTGLGSQGQREVATLLESLCVEKQPQAVLMLGDNFYFEGVQSPEDALWQSRFHDFYDSPCLKNLRFYVLLGNHDYDGNPEAQIRYTETSKGRWMMPARAYTVVFGDLLNLSVLDSNFPDRCFLSFFCSLDKIKANLDRQKAVWKIAAGHHPALSGGKYPRLKPFARLTMPPFLCEEKFAVYFAGHDHNFQHLRGPSDDVPCGLNQVILGNGGAELVQPRSLSQTLFAKGSYGAGLLSVTREALTVDFYEPANLNPIYTFSLSQESL
jgi:tartrate-resistant acid phosphatase type 5